jgi:hypothetical protein
MIIQETFDEVTREQKNESSASEPEAQTESDADKARRIHSF